MTIDMRPAASGKSLEELPFLDMGGEAYRRDPFATLAKLRPLPFVRSSRGVEVLTYELVADLQRDKRMDTLNIRNHPARNGGPLTREFMSDGRLVNLERTKHDRVRRVMMKGFTPGRIDALRDEMRAVANSLIDEVDTGAAWNFVDRFSHRYSIEMLTRLIGVPPEDIHIFEQATLDMGKVNQHPIDDALPRVEAALAVLHEYCEEMIAERRGADGDDFVSALIMAQSTEGSLTESELLWNVANLLFAGHDTTRNQLSSVMRALLIHDIWPAVVADRSLIPGAVAEAMRYFPAGLATAREVAEHGVEVADYALPAGTKLYFNMLSAGRDPSVFEDPDRFDIMRPNDRPIFFGSGIHKCVGHSLARTEMEVALDVLADRCPTLGLDGEIVIADADEPLWGPKKLPVTQP